MAVPGRGDASAQRARDVLTESGQADGNQTPDRLGPSGRDGGGDLASQTPDLPGPSGRDDGGDLASVPGDGPGPDIATDACVPLVCRDPTCYPAYCGDIGDGCGATLHCGGCPSGSSCRSGQCFADECQPNTCDNTTPFPYCGQIGNGCGATLDCACPSPAWACVGHVCVLPGCVPLPGCGDSSGWEYCGGLIGDGCGGVLDCRRECSRPGFVCRGNVCVDPRDAGPPAGPIPPPVQPPPPPLPPPPPPPACPPPPVATGGTAGSGGLGERAGRLEAVALSACPVRPTRVARRTPSAVMAPTKDATAPGYHPETAGILESSWPAATA